VVGALSFVPGPGVDAETMRNTLDWVWKKLDLAGHLGLGLSDDGNDGGAAGRTGRAVDALLLDTPKNHYGLNGHVYQRPGLTIYLPANGGLLYATALMAAGWDGAPKRTLPVFPTTASGTCAGKTCQPRHNLKQTAGQRPRRLERRWKIWSASTPMSTTAPMTAKLSDCQCPGD